MRSTLRKRLDAVEDNLGNGLCVVIYKGLPPYYVLEQRPGDRCKANEPLLINTPEELETYKLSLPRSAFVVQVVGGAVDDNGDAQDVPSSEIYSWGS
jgi:hypothetical protein